MHGTPVKMEIIAMRRERPWRAKSSSAIAEMKRQGSGAVYTTT
jgi:hypothetical protein